MADILRRLCFLSVLFGTALSVSPDGSVKKTMNLLCSVILICVVLTPLSDMDISEYALEMAKCRELEAEALMDNTQLNDRLNRMVIENECEAYIKDKAKLLGIEADVNVLAQWSTEGLWVPYEIRLNCKENFELSEIIKIELGIPKERQEWLG